MDIDICSHVSVHSCVHMHVHAHKYTCDCMHTHTQIYSCNCTHTHKYTWNCTYTHHLVYSNLCSWCARWVIFVKKLQMKHYLYERLKSNIKETTNAYLLLICQFWNTVMEHHLPPYQFPSRCLWMRGRRRSRRPPLLNSPMLSKACRGSWPRGVHFQPTATTITSSTPRPRHITLTVQH